MTKVDFRMTVFNVTEVDEKNFEFKAHLYLEYAWEDRRLYDIAQIKTMQRRLC